MWHTQMEPDAAGGPHLLGNCSTLSNSETNSTPVLMHYNGDKSQLVAMEQYCFERADKTQYESVLRPRLLQRHPDAASCVGHLGGW